MPKKFEKTGYDENGAPILPDNEGNIIEEGFYLAEDGLSYVSLNRRVNWWMIERHYEKPGDSTYLTEDNARKLERVVNSVGLARKMKSELNFMKRKASELFT